MQSNAVQPPPNPMNAGGGGPPPVPIGSEGAVPPPVPNANHQPGLNSQPPPIPNVPGPAVPPPVPQQPQQRRPTPQEMVERSRIAAQQSNPYQPPTTQPVAPQQPVVRRPPNPMKSFLQDIVTKPHQLKSAPVAERPQRKLVGRDLLLSQLAQGGRKLKKVEKKGEKEPEPEKVD